MKSSAPIGAGGVGEAYRARDPKLNRFVAIKVLHGEFGVDPDRLARFEREAQAVAALSHPGILAIHEPVSWTADGRGLFVGGGSTVPYRVYKIDLSAGQRTPCGQDLHFPPFL